MAFRRIVCVDNVNLTPEAYCDLQKISELMLVPSDSDPVDRQEICARIGDADCALVSWRTPVDDTVMSQCQSLRYIGLCASKYSNPETGNVDVRAARLRGIAVTGVGQYGDEATAEFIFCTLLNLCRGFEKIQWRDLPCELHGKKLGIIGMGAMGRHVLRLALGFGMEVVYFSQTRKPECEQLGGKYVSKEELLCSSDIISLHVPKGTHILSGAELALIRSDAVLVNTCLGIVFDPADFEAWIKRQNNIAVMDESADLAYRQFRDLANVIYPSVVAGRTAESRQRLSAQVLANVNAFLTGKPENLIN